MTGQSDDKNDERASGRPSLGGPAGGDVPRSAVAPDTANGKVSEDVARVVNLLQRLDKLHSNPQSPASPQPLDIASRDSPSLEPVKTRAPGADGLSSLSGLRDRSRGASLAPVPYLVPPALPPTLPQAAVLLAADRDEVQAIAGPDQAALAPTLHSAGAGTTAPRGPAGPAGPSRARPKKARAPLVLIGSLIVGVVGLGTWALFQFQDGGSGVMRGDREPINATMAPTHASMDAVGSVSPPLPEGPDGIAMAGCGYVALGVAKGVVTLTVTDPARAGQTIPIAVGDVALSSTFGPTGRLLLKAPLLGETAIIRWAGGSGASCESPAVLAADGALLRVALVSSAAGGLDLHVIEPNAWFGGPSGHISNLSPNADKGRGAGAIETFGGHDGARVVVYAVDPTRLPAGSLINAFVQPDSAGIPSCRAATNPAGDRNVVYQILILRSGLGQGLQREIRNFSMQIPACGETGGSAGPSERIMVRN